MSYEANREYYDTPGVPEVFGVDTNLTPAEEAILSTLQNEIRDKPLLDIGIGAGRTTPHLRAISKNYIGIDYSENMINTASKTADGATFLVCDARDMSVFKDEQFAAVFFSYNGIDYVDPSERLLILREVKRVLKKEGVFVFSSHNLDWWKKCRLFFFSKFSFSRNPITLIRHNVGPLRAYVGGLFKRVMTTVDDEGYAVVPVCVEFMVLPVYYITKEAQVRQLLNAGFRQVETIGAVGRPADNEGRFRDYQLHYVARKEKVQSNV